MRNRCWGLTGKAARGHRSLPVKATTVGHGPTRAVGPEEVTMGTVLELCNLGLSTRTQGRTGTVLARIKPTAAVPQSAWLTAVIRPAGTVGATTPAG
jgi:hypothetical protein